VNAEHGVVLWGADKEARRHHDIVVARLRIDVFDAVDALDEVFERARYEFDRVFRLVAIGGDDDIDHGHGNLRLLLARQRP
jgi:hypothetical protein